jgi:hypothetical protein
MTQAIDASPSRIEKYRCPFRVVALATSPCTRTVPGRPAAKAASMQRDSAVTESGSVPRARPVSALSFP